MWNGNRNRFRYEYKCRSGSALRFRLINSERAGSLSVIVSSIIAEIRFVSRRYSGKSVDYRRGKIVLFLLSEGSLCSHRFMTSFNRFSNFQIFFPNWITFLTKGVFERASRRETESARFGERIFRIICNESRFIYNCVIV